MRLAIADPPYLGRAARHYGPGTNGTPGFGSGPRRAANPRSGGPNIRHTTEHPDAGEWDNPDRHRRLLADLETGYDGWALACWATSLPILLEAAPSARIAVWVKPVAVPGGSRIIRSWEPVLLRIPPERTQRAPGNGIRDVLTAHPGIGHLGAKPRAWTRWVLDMLGYQDGDTVVDMFPGSGAVAAEIAQGVLPL